MALGSTQPLTEMSTRYLSFGGGGGGGGVVCGVVGGRVAFLGAGVWGCGFWGGGGGGGGGRGVQLTTLPHLCDDYCKFWSPEPLGSLRACPCLLRVKFFYGIVCQS